MNTPAFLKNMTQLELTVAAVLVLYIVLPINAPIMVCDLVDGPIGMVAVFTAAVYLFLYANPILAVLFVFAGYELLRRCCNVTGKAVIMKHTPTQAKKDKKMKKMNPPMKATLEEQMVEQMAPVGKSEPSVFMSSGFSPVAENVGSASVYN
jgi:hypothetical protein